MRFDQNVLLRNLLFIISFVILIPVYEREVSKYSRIYKQPPIIQIGNSRTCTKQSRIYVYIVTKHIGIC